MVPDNARAAALDRVIVALIAACALLLGTLEVFLIPFYVGSVLVPVAVVLAIAGNLVLPRWAYAAVPSGGVAALPFVAWLLPVLALPLYPRADGDVLVLGGGAQQWTFYGTVLLGCAAGFASILQLTGPARPNADPPPTRPRAQGRPGR